MEKIKIISVNDTIWNFYECMENGTKESMADYFETLLYHYNKRGKQNKELTRKVNK